MSDSGNLMDCSPPGSSVHRIFQARILKWVSISLFRGSSWPRDWTQVSGFVASFLQCRQILYWLSYQYSKVVQLYIYVYPFFFRCFSNVGYYRILSRITCAIQKVLADYLYIVMVNPQLLICPSSLPFPF